MNSATTGLLTIGKADTAGDAVAHGEVEPDRGGRHGATPGRMSCNDFSSAGQANKMWKKL